MIVLDNVSFHYPSSSKMVLDCVSLKIDVGERVSIVGMNASGKSTLAKIMTGLIEPDEGSVLVNGRRASDVLKSFTGRAPVAITFQNPDGHFVTASVTGEILFGMENIGISRGEKERRLMEALELFELEEVASRNPHNLSGGEKQRLALAAAWAAGAECLVLDEPFSFLDSRSRERLLAALEGAFSRVRTTIVWLALEDGEFPAADRVFYLENGRLQERGVGLERVYGETQLVVDDNDTVSLTGSCAGGETSDSLVYVEDAVFSYNEENFSLTVPALSVRRGECLGVTGLNGSGKSTLLIGCSGLMPPSRGVLRIMGREIKSRRNFPHGDVGFVFQIPESSFFKSTVFEEVAFGVDSRVSTERAVYGALSTVGLDPLEYSSRNPYSLSQSERRLVAIASILALDASVYFFDEPLIFLDASAKSRVIEVIANLKREGKGIIVASHDSAFIQKLGDRIMTCSDGLVR